MRSIGKSQKPGRVQIHEKNEKVIGIGVYGRKLGWR